MTDLVEVAAFKRLIFSEVDKFVSASGTLGEPLGTMAAMVQQAFIREYEFIKFGAVNVQPDSAALQNLLEPIGTAIREIQAFRDKNRHVEEFSNHIATIAESIFALSWVSMPSPTAPVQFVNDLKQAGDYFANRVLSSNKGNSTHVTWINRWNDVMKGLEQYIKDHYRTGFTWGSSASPVRAAAAHPPPPPPPPPFADPGSGGDDRHALLNQLNQGENIIQMLRPVARNQAPQEQQQRSSIPAAPTVKQPATQRTYPPKLLLEGKKWRVEHQKNVLDLQIPNDDMSESLAMFKCEHVGLHVKNKMNGVSIDHCKRTGVYVQSIISSVELIHCEGVELYCMGHVPLISLDQCESVQVFLTENSIDAEIISSKSTTLNVCLLSTDGDYVELAVPEQIKTVIVDRKLKSSVVEKI